MPKFGGVAPAGFVLNRICFYQPLVWLGGQRTIMKRKPAPRRGAPRRSCNETTVVYQEEEVGSDDDLNVLFKVPSSSIIDVAAPAHRRRVEQLDLVTGAVIGQWPSGRAASRHLRLSENFVGRVCRGLKDSAGGFRWRYVDESLGANEEAEEGEKVENEAEGEDEAEDEGEGELEDEGEDEAEDEDEDEEQLRPLSAATVAALRKRIRSLPKLRMRNSSQYRKILKLQTLLSTSRAEAARQRARADALAEAARQAGRADDEEGAAPALEARLRCAVRMRRAAEAEAARLRARAEACT